LMSDWPTVEPVVRCAVGPPLSCVSVHIYPTIHRIGSVDPISVKFCQSQTQLESVVLRMYAVESPTETMPIKANKRGKRRRADSEMRIDVYLVTVAEYVSSR
jgi:hypothetical protein